jgi:hypothetical protein
MSLALQSSTSDKSLNLWCLCVWLGAFLLAGDLSSHDKLTNVVLLCQVEELSNVVGSLGSKSLWYNRVCVGETGNVGFTLLDYNQVKSLHVGADNATSNRLSASFSSSSLSVARSASSQEKSDSVGYKYTCESIV